MTRYALGGAVRYQVIGLSRVLQRIQRMIPNRDFTPAPEVAGRYVIEQVREIFATGGHGSWPSSERVNQIGGSTLIDTGALYTALTQAARVARQSGYYLVPRGHGDGSPNPNGELHEATGVFRLKPGSVEVGVRSSYAVKTQTGFTSRRYGSAIPPRPYLYLTPQARQHIVRNWMKWSARSFSLAETGGI